MSLLWAVASAQDVQHFQPHELDTLRAKDFPGSIGDAAARSRFQRASESLDRMRPEHREAGGPLEHLDRFTEQVRADGAIHEPVKVQQHDDYFSLRDGHHRALAAHALGLPLPYKVVS